MWIEKLSNGKLRAVERYTDPLTGKQKKVSVVIPSDNKKQRKLASVLLQQKIEQKIQKSEDPEYITLKDLFDGFLFQKKQSLKSSSYYTFNTGVTQIRNSVDEDMQIKNINARYINNSILAMDVSLQRKNTLLDYFKQVLRWGYQNDYIDDVRFIDKLKPYNERKDYQEEENPLEKKLYLEYDELKNIISVCKKEYSRYMTRFLSLTGMRIGEAIALEYNDVDLNKRVISITKNYGTKVKETLSPKTPSSYRDIYIQDELLPLAKELKSLSMQNYLVNGYNTLFYHNGKPVIYGTYYSALKTAGRSLGYDIHPHVLRHTHVALLAEQGVSLEEISRRLGHDNSDITKKIYYHVTEKQKKKTQDLLNSVKIL